MKEHIQSLETKIALIQSDIHAIQTREAQLPTWLRNSAVGILGAMFIQIMTSVWWAASITTELNTMRSDVSQNTTFRVEYPKMHAETMVALKEIQVENEHMKGMLNEVKNKLRFVDLKSQVKE